MLLFSLRLGRGKLAEVEGVVGAEKETLDFSRDFGVTCDDVSRILLRRRVLNVTLHSGSLPS